MKRAFGLVFLLVFFFSLWTAGSVEIRFRCLELLQKLRIWLGG